MRFMLDSLLGREPANGVDARCGTSLGGFRRSVGALIAEVAVSIGVADLGPARVFQGAALTAGSHQLRHGALGLDAQFP